MATNRLSSSLIKSVQRGSTTSGSVTISSVDVNKSQLTVSSSNGFTTATSSQHASAKTGGGMISNSTTVTISYGLNANLSTISAPTVYWEVVEYA